MSDISITKKTPQMTTHSEDALPSLDDFIVDRTGATPQPAASSDPLKAVASALGIESFEPKETFGTPKIPVATQNEENASGAVESASKENEQKAEASSGEEAGDGGEGSSHPPIEEQHVVEVLSTIYDPEIPVNIYELGLIYTINIENNNEIYVDMTLTTPACPVAGTLPGQVEAAIQAMPGVEKVQVELVWDPPWHMDLMSEGAKLELGFF